MTFYDAIVAHGLRPRQTVARDGRWHRCPTESHPRKRNGSYKLAADGGIGWFMDFAIDQAPHTWRPDRTDVQPTYDPEWLKRAQEEARRHVKEATLSARRFYSSCAPLRTEHPYLAAHSLDMTGAYGLRVDSSGWIVVPAYRGNELMTVQRISPTGEKLFWPRASVKGACFTISRRRASLTVLCEGLATGLAIYTAVPESCVVVTFNAGNLRHAPRHHGLVVIGADNDWETQERIGKNPGVAAATEAAETFGCGIAIPEDIEGTDWADWRNEIYQARLELRRPKERESDVRRAVDASMAMQIKRAAKFIAPRMALV